MPQAAHPGRDQAGHTGSRGVPCGPVLRPGPQSATIWAKGLVNLALDANHDELPSRVSGEYEQIGLARPRSAW